MVLDRPQETSRVMMIPMRTKATTTAAASRELYVALRELFIKILDKIIRIGKRPLQGTKLLVMIAISFSLGESMIRAEITPAALQPNPMLMVRACLPWEPALLNKLSRLKATRGR